MTTLVITTAPADASPIVNQGDLVQLCLQQVLSKEIAGDTIPYISVDCSNWKSFCDQASQMGVLTISCDQLVTKKGNLTSTGWTAIGCIIYGLELSKSIDPGMLASIHPECEQIVNMSALINLPPYPSSFPILR